MEAIKRTINFLKLLATTLGVALFVVLALASTARASQQLHVQGRNFVNAQGQVVILRGVVQTLDRNVYYHPPAFDLSKLDRLVEWGVNVVRLGFFWEGVEPTRGVYDQEYLQQIEAFVDAAWARGIYTYLDFHQDGYSRYVAGGCGRGFPLWAHSPAVQLTDPTTADCGNKWTIQVLDPNTHIAFGDFHANWNGIRDRYLDLWRMLAQRFRSHPGMIGYELMNEPWGWEIWELAPLYEDAALAIRSEDPTGIIFIEGHATTNGGAIQTLLPKPTFSNFVYAPHFYDWGVYGTSFYSGLTLPTDLGFFNMTGKASEWNVPMLLDEFGAFNDTWNINAYMDLQYQKLNESLASATQWTFTEGGGGTYTCAQSDLAAMDSYGNICASYKIRPFAPRIAGTPVSLAAWGDGSVELRWDHNPGVGTTEVFVPRQALFGSQQLKIEKEGSNLSCNYNSNQTRMICTSSSTGQKRVKVRPCVMFFGMCL